MSSKMEEEKKVYVERVITDPSEGLNEEQINERIRAGAINTSVESSTQTVSEIVKSNVFTYFNFVFLILGILLVIAGAWRDLIFLLIIVANTCIGIIQEVHSKKVLDKLSILDAQMIKTIRCKKVVEVASEELLLDDIVLLDAGCQIPADAIVVEGQAAVNEALVTGEADEIIKKKGDKLLSGSFIVSGHIKARLDKVGADSFVSKLTIKATKAKKGEQSEMIRSLNRLIQIVGVIIIPIGICLFVQSYVYNQNSFQSSISGMVAAVIGMIPEGLFLLTSVAMAVSTVRLAKKQVLVHDMKCIETLARVNVLCVDKTGTITEPGMKVYKTEYLTEDCAQEEIEQLISDFAQNMSSDNITMEAIQSFYTNATGRRADKVQGFSSQTKYSGIRMQNETFVMGAPELLLRDKYELYREKVEVYSTKGFRVVLFAKYDGELEGKPLINQVHPLAVIALANPIRKGAVDTFSYFNKHGVEIKVISGDNPVTVSAIAGEAGIKNYDQYVDVSTLDTMDDFVYAAKKYTVFGRVTPARKSMLIKALKQNGKTVAMTGDGVNDVLALKEADCSVAMASGSEAASNASQIVLMDSDFSKMPPVIMEGRRVVNNIERTAVLYLVKNIFSMLMAVFSVIKMFEYPLEPSQVSLISLFTIGIPSFILALEPNTNPIKGKFLRNVMFRALPAGLTNFIAVSGLIIFCKEFNVDTVCLSTSCTILVAIVGFMVLYRLTKPMNAGHTIMLIGLILGWLFCMLFIGRLFAITSISKQCAMLMVIFAMLTEPVLRYIHRLFDGMDYLSKKRKLKHSAR